MSLSSEGSHSHGRLFLPYREGERSYIVVKEPRRDGPSTAKDLPIPPPHLLMGHQDAEQFLEWGSSIFPP
jgi:hypothetical protein